MESKYILPMFWFLNLCSDIIATSQFVLCSRDERHNVEDIAPLTFHARILTMEVIRKYKWYTLKFITGSVKDSVVQQSVSTYVGRWPSIAIFSGDCTSLFPLMFAQPSSASYAFRPEVGIFYQVCMMRWNVQFCGEKSASGFWFEENKMCYFDTFKFILDIILNKQTIVLY